MSKCPEVFDYFSIAERVSGDFFHHSDIFLDGDGDEKLKELADWIRDLPCSSASRQPCGTLTLDDTIVKAIEDEVTENTEAAHPKQQITMQLRPHLIYKPNLSKGGSLPDPDSEFYLFDRVINVREGFSVPLGLRGTVIGLIKGTRPEDSPVEVLFDREFHGGLNIRCSTGKAYRVPRSALVNISHGDRKTKPQNQQQQQHHHQQQHQRGQNKPKFAKHAPQTEDLRRTPKSKSGDVMYSKILRDSPSRDASAKHVTPPDPKQLPMPSAFFSSNSNDGNKKFKKQDGKPLDMKDLWTAVEQASAPQQPANDDSAITASVQQFFANHQHLQHTQAPPVAQQNSSFPGPPQIGGAPIFQQPQEVVEQPRSTGFNANFIPLQVQRSQIGRGRGGGGRGRGGKKQDHGDGAHQQFYHHQPPQSYHHAEASGQQQYHQQPSQPQHAGRGKPRGRGRGRGRGQLAANFSYNP